MVKNNDAKPGRAIMVVGVLILLLLLYVASIGPTAIVALGSDSDRVFATWAIFYSPIILPATLSQPTNNALERYINWWLGGDNSISFDG